MALTIGTDEHEDPQGGEDAQDQPVVLGGPLMREHWGSNGVDPGEPAASVPAPAPAPVVEAPAAAGDRLVLFELDGVKYYVPRRPGPNVALGYLRDIRRKGEEYARAGLLERFIGRAGMDALADYEDLTDEDMERIWGLVEKHVLGPMKATGKGKGTPGRR